MKNFIYILVIGLGLLLDQLSKWLIVQKLPLGAGFAVIPGLLGIRHVHNTGAAWSLFSGSTLALAVFSLLMVAVLAVWFWRTPAAFFWQRLALSLIISGALGNMIDRFRLGYVVDFLELPHWPVFNVADMLLCCGVALLVVLVIFEERLLGKAADKNTQREDAE